MDATIVVGYDGSAHGVDALALGESLAAATEGTLVLGCVFVPDEGISARIGPDPAADRRRHSARDLLAAAPLRAPRGTRVRRRAIAASTPADGLRRLAEQESAEVIVLGSTTRSGLERVSPGSVAERLMLGAPCALAVAPVGYGAGSRRLRSIAVAFDGRPESVHALHAAQALARRSGAGVHILRVLPNVDRDPADVLVAATREGFDLLVAGSRGRGPLRRAVAGSVSGRLMRTARCPVCVVPRGVELALDDAPRAGDAAAR